MTDTPPTPETAALLYAREDMASMAEACGCLPAAAEWRSGIHDAGADIASRVSAYRAGYAAALAAPMPATPATMERARELLAAKVDVRRLQKFSEFRRTKCP